MIAPENLGLTITNTLEAIVSRQILSGLECEGWG